MFYGWFINYDVFCEQIKHLAESKVHYDHSLSMKEENNVSL